MQNIATLSSSAMLVDMTIGQWSGTKRDKRASETITELNNAKRGVARVNKDVLGDNPMLDAIKKFVGNVRNTHTFMTLCWYDNGARLLTTKQYFKYHEVMTRAQGEFHHLVDMFIADYDSAVIEAKLELGDMFDPNDYPTAESLRSRFRFTIEYSPLPDSGDFRLDLPNEAMREMQQSLERQFMERSQAAMQDIWSRLHKALEHMSAKLDIDNTADGKKKRYHDSLVPNLLEIVDLLDTCNIAGDSQMSAMRDRLDSAFRGVTTDALKEDEFLRTVTKREVDAVLSQLPSLDF